MMGGVSTPVRGVPHTYPVVCNMLYELPARWLPQCVGAYDSCLSAVLKIWYRSAAAACNN